MKQKKQVFEDSLNSTRAALEEGIVAGGGAALLHASTATTLKLTGEEAIGAHIVLKACEAPMRQIATNTGFDSSLIIGEVLAARTPNMGFNAHTEQVHDLVQSGIIDPAKVVKNALRFAASTAGVILLSETLIGNAPEEEEEKQ
jgi:chaperonin GroEL